MNKKGFELSINFLVVLIMSIVIFGLGIILVTKIMSSGEGVEDKVSENLKRSLNSAMDDGSLVVVPDNREDARRGDVVSFAVGIRNTECDDNTFTLQVENKNGLAEANYVTSYTNVERNDRIYALVAIKIPNDAAPGQYAYDISVDAQHVPPGCAGENEPWGTKKRVYVVI